MAAAEDPVRPSHSLKPPGIHSVISDLSSLDLSFLTSAWRDISADHRDALLPVDVRVEEHHSHSIPHASSTTQQTQEEEEQQPCTTQKQQGIPSTAQKQQGSAPIRSEQPWLDPPSTSKDTFSKGTSKETPKEASSIAQTPSVDQSASELKEEQSASMPSVGQSGAAPESKSSGVPSSGVPLKEPVSCQVACLSWPGSKDGFKKSNQDAYCFMRTTDKQSLLFGVFDGHGPRGRDASQLCKHRLPELLMQSGDTLISGTPEAFTTAFATMQHEITLQKSFDSAVSGTTAVMAHLHKRILTVAWAGDSRAVLASTDSSGNLVATEVSEDHKPENEEEKERIEASNGSVYRDVNEYGEDVGPFRVWSKQGPMLGLAMSRSLGDRLAHVVGVSAVPDVKAVELKEADQFLILASDGVWEWISNEEAVNVVKSCATSTAGAKKLMQLAKSKWLAFDVGSYVDDITALVVSFTHNDGF